MRFIRILSKVFASYAKFYAVTFSMSYQVVYLVISNTCRSNLQLTQYNVQIAPANTCSYAQDFTLYKCTRQCDIEDLPNNCVSKTAYVFNTLRNRNSVTITFPPRLKHFHYRETFSIYPYHVGFDLDSSCSTGWPSFSDVAETMKNEASRLCTASTTDYYCIDLLGEKFENVMLPYLRSPSGCLQKPNHCKNEAMSPESIFTIGLPKYALSIREGESHGDVQCIIDGRSSKKYHWEELTSPYLCENAIRRPVLNYLNESFSLITCPDYTNICNESTPVYIIMQHKNNTKEILQGSNWLVHTASLFLEYLNIGCARQENIGCGLLPGEYYISSTKDPIFISQIHDLAEDWKLSRGKSTNFLASVTGVSNSKIGCGFLNGEFINETLQFLEIVTINDEIVNVKVYIENQGTNGLGYISDSLEGYEDTCNITVECSNWNKYLTHSLKPIS